MVNEGVPLNTGLDSKASTYDNTSTEQHDRSSSSGYAADAKRVRVDKVVSEKENVTVGPSYDKDTLTEVHLSNNNTFENVFALGIQNHEQLEVENCTKVNREAQQANAFLTKELERYKEKEKHFAKETTNESEYYKNIKLLNEEISNLKSQACQKEKSFHKENEKYSLTPSLYNIDEMGKYLLSDPKIISEEELKCDIMRKVQNQFSKEFEPLARNKNHPLRSFEQSLVKEMKDDLKYVMSLEDEFDEKWQHGQFSKEKSTAKYDIDEIETINIELEHSVAKLLTENEHLNNEQEHLKQTYKDLYVSIKKTGVQTKDHNDSLISQLNKKSIENFDLKLRFKKRFLQLLL
ncbi:hypothetical protein Tco_0516055 [Tanacetum coccineum]